MGPQELRETIRKKKADVEPKTPTLQDKNPQVVFSWKAPLRAYKRKSAGVLRFYIAVALLLSLIAFFFGERILILPIWATIFLVYVLTITPPPRVVNKITKFGVETAGNTYRWDFLSHFYFIKKFNYHVLVLVSVPPYLAHMYLVIEDKETKIKLTKLLSNYLIFQEKPQRSFTDRAADWLTKLMPDEDEQEVTKESQVDVSPVAE